MLLPLLQNNLLEQQAGTGTLVAGSASASGAGVSASVGSGALAAGSSSVSGSGGIPANAWPTRAAESAANFLDHFTGSALDSAKWGSVVSGTGAVTVTDSYVECDFPANSAAFIYHKTKLDKSKSQLWLIAASMEVIGSSVYFPLISVINDASTPTAAASATAIAKERINWNFVDGDTDGVISTWGIYQNSGGTDQVWDTASATWGGFGSGKASVNPVRASDYYVFGIEIDAAGSRFRLLQYAKTYTSGYTFDQGWRLFALSDWVSWSSTGTSDDLWLIIGRTYTDDSRARTLRVEWVRYAEQGSAGLIESWSAIKGPSGSALGTHEALRHYWSYDGRTFVPEGRTADALTITGSGWESADLQTPMVVRDGSTDYLFYSGLNSDFSVSGIGVATATAATPQNGPWARSGSNPLVEAQSGEDRTRYFFALKDNIESDATKRWKIVYAVQRSSDGLEVIKLATAPAATGPYTYRGEIIGVGSASDPDEGGIHGGATPGVVYINGQYEVYYTGLDASGVTRLLRAYGPSLESLTKDGEVYYESPSVTQALTANLTGRTVTVADTTGFVADAMVFLDQDSNFNNFGTSRIRKVLSGTQLELYHGLDGFTTASGAKIRQVDATARVGGQQLIQVGTEWWMYMTQWGAFDDDASIRALLEQNCLYRHTGIYPSSSSFAMDMLASPVTPRGENDDLYSVENMGLLMTPLEGISGTGTPAAQAATVSGDGVSGSPGSGALSAAAATASGAGVSSSPGSGDLAAPSASASGAGLSSSTGTGALVAQAAAVAGSGTTSGAVDGSGELVCQSASVAGVGTVTALNPHGRRAPSARISEPARRPKSPPTQRRPHPRRN